MSATSSGGKYTRELKLRVLEHYFRNGGDVFGNKQATSKKFGVDSKTINRFLKLADLVRLARKNAKSSGKSSSSFDNFKEPAAPGGSGRPQRQAAKPALRINLPEDADEAVINQPADQNTSSVGKLIKVFELGTQELRDLLLAECDLVYECRVCRGLFRCLANLLAHKRRFCTRAYRDTRQVFGDGPGQSLSTTSDGVVILPLPAAIDRLPEVRQAAAVAVRAAVAEPLPTVRLETLPNTRAAVAQTVGEQERTTVDRLDELARMEAARGNTVRLGRDGKVVESGDEEEGMEAGGATVPGEEERHVCKLCNTTFSTRKTLSHHVRSLHAATRVYFPCACCSAAFINMFSVERHLQKAHKKRPEEIETLKEAIRKKAFQRNVSQADVVPPGSPLKVTSFEWKCRQCSRRFLSLPVGLQHVHASHAHQYPMPRAGLVRVCRVLRQPGSATTTGAGAASAPTLSSSGLASPAHAPTDQADVADTSASAGNDSRLAFNKANLLHRLSNGRERCVLCQKEFTAHIQACGHLRLHDQAQIEAYLGQKVRLTKKGKPVTVQHQQQPQQKPQQQQEEEYELDDAAIAAAGGDEEREGGESEGANTLAEASTRPPLASVQSRGYPVHMKPVDEVCRRDFIHTDAAAGTSACTLCEARFERVKAARAHMARHSLTEVRHYVTRHAVNGMVGVPAAPPSPTAAAEQTPDRDADDAESVDTDIEAGAKLLVSCKLWSPGNRQAAGKDDTDKASDGGDDGDNADLYDDYEGADDEVVHDVESELLAKEIDGEVVDKWEAIRRKGERYRCVVCNRTFMRNVSAEQHLRVDHTFEEVRDFLNKWPFKGIRVPPRNGNVEDKFDDDEDEDMPLASIPVVDKRAPEERVDKRAPEERVDKRAPERGPNRRDAVSLAVKQQPAMEPPPPPSPPPPPVLLKGLKRVAGDAAPLGRMIKIARRALPEPVKAIGPNTKILRISRSDLLARRATGDCECLVCNTLFTTHALACVHMRQHSDADIRNFIKTRGREFLPAFEQSSLNRPPAAAAPGGAVAKHAAASPAAVAQKAPATNVAQSPSAAEVGQRKLPTTITVSSAARTKNTSTTATSSTATASKSVVLKVVMAAANTRTANSSPSKAPEPASTAAEPDAAAAQVAQSSDAPDGVESPRASRRLRSTEPQETERHSSDSDESDGLHRDDAVREFEMFDKVQLLKRYGEDTRCLLCGRQFTKYSSACGHLSHHSPEQVQQWREQMRLKAASVLRKARQAPAAATAAVVKAAEKQDESQPEGEATKALKRSKSTETVSNCNEEQTEEGVDRGKSVGALLLTPRLLKPIRSLESVAKRLKAAHTTMERIDYLPENVQSRESPSNPVDKWNKQAESHSETGQSDKLRSVRPNRSKESAEADSASSNKNGEQPPSAKLTSVAKSGAAPKTDIEPKTDVPKTDTAKPQSSAKSPEDGGKPVTKKSHSSCTPSSGPAAEHVPELETPSELETSSSGEPPVLERLAVCEKATSPEVSEPPVLEKVSPAPSAEKHSDPVISAAKTLSTPPVNTASGPATAKTTSETAGNLSTITKPLPADKPSAVGKQAVSAVTKTVTVAISVPSSLSVSGGAPVRTVSSHLSGISTVVVGGKQLVKLAVVSSVPDGAGRTIMKLAPAVKLPVTAVSVSQVQRMLRPLAPKVSLPAAGVATGDPPAPAPLVSCGVVMAGSPRSRPPPLLRAPMLQAVVTASRGPTPLQLQLPALRTTTAAGGYGKAVPLVTVTSASAAASRTAATSQTAPVRKQPVKQHTGNTNEQPKSTVPSNRVGTVLKRDAVAVKVEPTSAVESSKPMRGDSGSTTPSKDDKVQGKLTIFSGDARPVQTHQRKPSAAESTPVVTATSGDSSTVKRPATQSKQVTTATTPESKKSPSNRQFASEPKKAVTASSIQKTPSPKTSPPASKPTPQKTYVKSSPVAAKASTASTKPAVLKRTVATVASEQRLQQRSWSAADLLSPRPTLPEKEVPQTRARAEAALAARVRQTRRRRSASASHAAAERK